MALSAFRETMAEMGGFIPAHDISTLYGLVDGGFTTEDRLWMMGHLTAFLLQQIGDGECIPLVVPPTLEESMKYQNERGQIEGNADRSPALVVWELENLAGLATALWCQGFVAGNLHHRRSSDQ